MIARPAHNTEGQPAALTGWFCSGKIVRLTHRQSGFMIGTALILLTTVLFCIRLRRLPPAARVAAGYALGIGIPVAVLCLLARFGVQANRFVVGVVFAVILGFLIGTRRKSDSLPDDTHWTGLLGLTLAATAITALVSPSPAGHTLVDPWAHIAWSRNLPEALELYSPGFPAFLAILGIDDRLIGAFRMAPLVLHAALIAQFLALGERVRALWPAVICALAYLTVPVAFGKFEPPRPELLAAVLVAASWWVLGSNALGTRSKCLALGGLSCMLVASHVSYLEAGHLVALGLAVLWGGPDGWRTRRLPLLVSIAAGALLSLVISPSPLAHVSRVESLPVTTSQETAVGLIDPIGIARMVGWMFAIAGAASLAWMAFGGRRAYRYLGGVFPGLFVFGVLNVAPLVLIAVGVRIPISFAPYRHVLAAVLPLAMLITIVSGLVRMWTRWGYHVFILLTALLALQVVTRPTFSWALGIAALVVAIAAAWAASRARTSKTRAAACALALAVAVGVRLWMWLPTLPPEASWLIEHGDPRVAAISNWPLTNALDALVPQRVIDGLAGNDANVARHRSEAISSLRDHLAWCGDRTAVTVDSLRASLGRMSALPAYLVVGGRFAESWQVYAEHRKTVVRSGDLDPHSYFAAEPCPEPAAERVEKIREALERHPSVRREFDTEQVAVYRID